MEATCSNIVQVWSFSPPEDDLIDVYRSGSPVSMPDHAMTDCDDDQEHHPTEDVDMQDVFVSKTRNVRPSSVTERVARRMASASGRKDSVDSYGGGPPKRLSE